ncbi:hypothetical protein HZS55_16405 [Halosimplex rubrum]|uniref:Uncharacterized protein n=1 Tax=Halosimplex rubrum TaxID=869889 RepID=A0A7D5T837_9EURY|nr:hypothetical protein [Halosimplex rubrum]QLH78775.1 hypothetical protein HZS55_16405 [Halosimplex rubrum]
MPERAADRSVPLYASTAGTNLLIALLTVTVAAGFAGAEPVVHAVLYGLPALAAVAWVTHLGERGD